MNQDIALPPTDNLQQWTQSLRPVSQEDIIFPIDTIKQKLQLQNQVRWIIWLLRIKLKALYSLNETTLPDSNTTMFDRLDGDNYIFRVGSHFKFTLPTKFIQDTQYTTNKDFDFLVQNWKFFLNWEEIPLSAWVETTLIDTLIQDSSARVAETISMQWMTQEEIELMNRRNSKEIQWLRWSLNRMVNKLLPNRLGQVTSINSRLPEIWKRPVFSIIPRV